MHRYIDIVTLFDDVKASMIANNHIKPVARQCHAAEHQRLMSIISRQPIADVAEVRHGYWKWDVETHGDLVDGTDEDFGYRCSICEVWADEYGVDGDIYEEPPTHILHYCPNCGAKMDVGRAE